MPCHLLSHSACLWRHRTLTSCYREGWRRKEWRNCTQSAAPPRAAPPRSALSSPGRPPPRAGAGTLAGGQAQASLMLDVGQPQLLLAEQRVLASSAPSVIPRPFCHPQGRRLLRSGEGGSGPAWLSRAEQAAGLAPHGPGGGGQPGSVNKGRTSGPAGASLAGIKTPEPVVQNGIFPWKLNEHLTFF